MTAAAVAKPRDGEGLSSHVLGTVLLVAAEVMFFAGLVSALLVARANMTVWSVADQPRFPVLRTALNSMILLLSGLTLRRAAREERASGWSQDVTRWVGITAVLGGMFLSLQGVEWFRLLRHGITATVSLAAGFFYLIVGAHALHVIAGLIVLGIVGLGAPSRRRLEVAVIYWSFVVLLWPVLYVLVYLA